MSWSFRSLLIGRCKVKLFREWVGCERTFDPRTAQELLLRRLWLEFPMEHSLKVITLDAFEITPLAGTPTQMGRWAAIELLSKASSTGLDIQKISQAEIARTLGITQGRVSQLFSALGGWKLFKKLLVPLLENIKGKLINETGEGMEFLRVCLALPPIQALAEVVNLVRTCGWKDFVEVVAAASAQTQLRIMGLLPQALQDEISNTTARRKAVLVVQSASAKY